MKKNPSIGVSNSEIINLPLKFLTRHGLIAGSTGTGKSRTMQTIAEQLSDAGVNVFVSDIKGDASGFCVEGKENERNEAAPYLPHAIDSNYWSIGKRLCPLRFSLTDVGYVLVGRLLDLNPTQESHLSLAFSYAKNNNIELDELDSLLYVLEQMVELKERGISKSSVQVIERKIMAMQASGIGEIFGKPSILLKDLSGLNVLNLSNKRNNMGVSIAPAFLLQMLFDKLPEVGNSESPKFAVFFDEAHYLFKDANKSLRDRMVTILKQIRSKGVCVFFITQDVSDLPDEILSQLSTKIIFSQKVFTQKGAKRLRALAESFPDSELDVVERLKRLPPGVAIVSSLDADGNQTEPKEVRMFAPATTMEVVDDAVLLDCTDDKLLGKYSEKKSAKIPASNLDSPQSKKEEPKDDKKKEKHKPRQKNTGKKAKSVWDMVFGFLLKFLDFLLKAIGKIFSFIIFKPLKRYYKWMMKKKIRIIYSLVFLLIAYFLIVNLDKVGAILEMMKL